MSFGLQLDSSMDMLEETRFKKRNSDLIKRLSKVLHFNELELEAIFIIYYKLVKNRPGKHDTITKEQFKDFLHCGLDMTDSNLTNIMLMSYFKGGNPVISMEMWATILSFLVRGTPEEQIKHCYRVYDTMNTGKIGRDAMLGFLENALIGQDEDAEDAAKDMIEILTKKMDVDRDGRISAEDYRQTCLAEPLLMESLGSCLPTRLGILTFTTTFTHNIAKL